MNKKTKILEAALEMFGSQGFHETKIKDIAIKADIGKGTVYEYFNSKSDLLLSSIYYALDLYLIALEEINQSNLPIEEKFKAIVEMDLEGAKYQMNLMHNVLKDQANNACDLGERFIEFKHKKQEVLSEIFDNIVNNTNHEVVQMILAGTINQFITEKTMMNSPMTVEDFTDSIFDVLRKL